MGGPATLWPGRKATRSHTFRWPLPNSIASGGFRSAVRPRHTVVSVVAAVDHSGDLRWWPMSPPFRQPLLPAVEAAVRRGRLAGSQVIVAVSGGADSVALLHTLHDLSRQYQLDLVVSHFNHRWRGLESDADEFFVVDLARVLGLPCAVGRAVGQSTHAEEDARGERYRFLTDAATSRNAPFVVTAHTRDDQMETVLFRMIRGSGWRGLAGIPFERPLASSTVRVVRPMLDVSRSEIEAALTERGLSWRVDSSNRSPLHARNRLRHEALPLLREIHPGVDSALLELAEHAATMSRDIEQRTVELRRTALVSDGVTRQIWSRSELAKGSPFVVCESLRCAWRAAGWPEVDMTADHWRRLTDLATVDGVEMFPGAVRARAVGDVLELTRTLPA
jgi:tRNA(Ile)-lysidine synthase